MVAYRRNRNLNDILVSRRLPNNVSITSNANINIDKNSSLCEICGRRFQNGRGKIIHYKRIHDNNSENSVPPIGFSKCGDIRCNTCKKGVFGDTIFVTETKETFKITQRITCKTRNIIYCITCQNCKEQYIGETGNELHCRQSGHFSDIKTKKYGLPYVRHFLECGIEYYSVTGVEKVRSRDPLIRKQRESFYKDLFKVKMK